jgi:demethylmenaquinone methyltransferase/2-methoxy-6-polyprenyl-1,4-benzoquinol methylase
VTSLPVGAAKTKRVREMFDQIAPRYELVNHVMTMGMDSRWRRRAVRDLRLPPGSTVLDVATGTGDFARELRRQDLRAVGVDLSFGMLAAGGDESRVQADASELPFEDASFDGVTCGYGLRNFTDLAACLGEMARVTRPGGRICLLELAEPRSVPWRWGFRVWFRRIVPLVGSVLSDAAAYRYLPASTAYLPDADALSEMLRDAGYSSVNHRLVAGGLSQQFIATRRA